MPTEPERYDIDDMMDRLKNRSKGSAENEGELVTRADGTQAIKVRRHKRRSRQPHKEKQRRVRMLQVSALLVSLMALVLLGAFATIYVNTSPFRKQVVKKVGLATGAEVDLKQFRMNPLGANVSSADLKWPSGNVLQGLSLRMLRADVSPLAVFGGRITGLEMQAQTGRLQLRLPEMGEKLRAVPAVSGELPVRFDQFGIKDFQLHLNGAQGSLIRLLNSEATFIPADQQKPPQLRVSRGDLQIRHWSPLRMDRAHIEFVDDAARIVGLRVKHHEDEKGILELSGKLSPYVIDSNSRLRVHAESFLLSGIVGEDLGNLLSGRVDTTDEFGASELEVTFGESPETALSMPFRGTLTSSFQMKNLPFLYSLSYLLGDEWFGQPTFEQLVLGKVVRRGALTELQDLDLVSKGRMAVRGVLRNEGGRLSGNLEVGLAYGMVTSSENLVLEEMFSEPREGYRWIDIELSGTPKVPVDHFNKLYQQTLDRLKEEPVAQDSGAEPMNFDALTRPE